MPKNTINTIRMLAAKEGKASEIRNIPFDENVKLLVEQLVKQGYPPLLKQRHIEELTGLGKSTLEQARLTGRLKLPWCRLGRSVRYPLDSTAAFIVGLQRFTSTSEADACVSD